MTQIDIENPLLKLLSRGFIVSDRCRPRYPHFAGALRRSADSELGLCDRLHFCRFFRHKTQRLKARERGFEAGEARFYCFELSDLHL